MFSLWWDKTAKECNIWGRKEPHVHVKKIIQNVPSPRQNRFYRYCRQFFSKIHFCKAAIERTWMFISCLGQADAGMTVEASLVLPLFLLFFVNIGSAMEMIRLHSNIELALYDMGRSMSIYGYALADVKEVYQTDEERVGQVVEGIGEFALTNLYVKNQLIHYLGRDYLDESPIVGGASGLDLYESVLLDEEGHMKIIVTYQVSPTVGIGAFQDFRMMNKYYGHIWSGYQLSDTPVQGVVYIAEHGSVYHEDRDCTHLSLSVRGTTMGAVTWERNNAGERYRICDKCVRQEVIFDHETVYVTGEGDCFHIRRECPGLKRTVYILPESSKKEYRPCSRCAYENLE